MFEHPCAGESFCPHTTQKEFTKFLQIGQFPVSREMDPSNPIQEGPQAPQVHKHLQRLR